MQTKTLRQILSNPTKRRMRYVKILRSIRKRQRQAIKASRS